MHEYIEMNQSKREREIFFVFSNDSLTIEKKLRVEDFRLLRQRFNRATLDGYEHTTKDNNRLAGKVEEFDFSSLIFLSFRFIE